MVAREPRCNTPIASASMTMNTRKPARRATPLNMEGSPPVAKLGPDIKAKIGHKLRLMYDEVISQGVPDRFVEILRGLDDPPKEGSNNGSS